MKTPPNTYHLVIGLGTSGMSMARFLHSISTPVVATDMDASKTDAAKELNMLGIETQIGFHDQDTFNNAAALVPSPGIPVTNKYIQAAVNSGVRLTSELDIFSEHNDRPVIAITGTNGKTTTTTLIGDMLTACGKTVFVGGNIGTPLVDHLMQEKKADIIVAEISSFQLDISQQFAPHVGVLLNISEDHLDRYDSFNDYENSKWSLFKHQGKSDFAVVNASIKEFKPQSEKLISKLLTFSSQKDAQNHCHAIITSENISIRFEGIRNQIDIQPLKQLSGTHNHENIAAAILSCLAAGADIKGILKGLAQFKNLAHRIQWVRDVNGVSFYNDSKGTNTDAVIRAIQCFDSKIILILGGREKNTDFSLLLPAVKQNVKAIIAIGESKQHVTQTFKSVCPVIEVQTMEKAVQTAFHAADKNEIVLLSPACASFDMYNNYSHRGNDFMNHVNHLESR